jgi:hypothetical protein
MKLQDLLKDLELGKVYTDKDRKPFKVNEDKCNCNCNCHSDNIDEAGAIGGALDLTDMNTSYVAPKRDTDGVKNQGVFLQKFSSKEAKAIIDGNLKLWAKELRKVQYKVIKDWMSAAKSGKIDFFDIIRGLKTGDVSRAHQYETDFLVSVLTRDKIIDRFRKYFGGKKGKSGRRK